jgi:hypothetical protein
MQASDTKGRSRFTAQAEDKVERALTSFYARRIEIQETVVCVIFLWWCRKKLTLSLEMQEFVESNKLRLADVHRNMNLLMAAAASALERGNMDVQVIPRAGNDGEEDNKENGGDLRDDDTSGSRATRGSGVDADGADDRAAGRGSLRKNDFDSDDESLESEDTRSPRNYGNARDDLNGPVIVKVLNVLTQDFQVHINDIISQHFFELISEKERKIKS